jgi:hypothetical protein
MPFNDTSDGATRHADKHTLAYIKQLEDALNPVAEAKQYFARRGSTYDPVHCGETGYALFRLHYGTVAKAREVLGLPEWTEPEEN